MPDKPYLDSWALSDLRAFVGLYPELEKVIGPIAQFKIVLDANFVISDLIRKYMEPTLKQTAIEEVAKSSAIEFYAPTWLETEITESAIPQVSKKKGIPETALLSMWSEYRTHIVWEDSFAAPDSAGPISGDSKDVPYVSLQRHISAVAILSRDKDIDELGGKRVSFDFVLSARSYARAKSYAVAIRIGGALVGTLSIGALVQVVRGIGSLLTQLPDWLKVSLLILAVFVIVHPKSRQYVIDFLKSLGDGAAELWPMIEELTELAMEKQREAELALSETESFLGAQ